MAECPECEAEHVVVYYCETCGNYGCTECGDHCRGCHTAMDEYEV